MQTNKSCRLLPLILGILGSAILFLYSPTKYYIESYYHPSVLKQRLNDGGGNNNFKVDTDNPRVLNVHIVPHTHDDVGWLKTVDQYYFGLNQTIQNASVQDILDSVIGALLENPARTFTYVEQKFFTMWWERQSDAVRDSVRYLVANRQLNFVNGGWCMHDEATTHYIGMIDQMTLGHSFLKRELGIVPKVAWQLDPFGHSSTQASLMTSKMGFDAIYFGRIDHQDLKRRKADQQCEGLWNSSRNLKDSTVFWGLSGSNSGMYGAPFGFCFDVSCNDQQVTAMNQTMLKQTVRQFLRAVKTQSDQVNSNHIMLTMGEDFQYQQARRNFANLDALISSVSNLQKWKIIDMAKLLGPRFDAVNILYSSPEFYTKCKYREMKSNFTTKNGGVSVKEDDFFPYSDHDHSFWTGYFTSRPSLKRMERKASSFLLAARQIETLVDSSGNQVDFRQCHGNFLDLEDAVGVVQHHDGVSGTSKQHVANDYAWRLHDAINKVSNCTATKLRNLFLGENNAGSYLNDLNLCHQLNESICYASQEATDGTNNDDVYVIVYNGLGYARPHHVVNLPVSRLGAYIVSKVEAKGKQSTVVDSIPAPIGISKESSQYILPIETGSIPPLGSSVFQVRQSSKTLMKNRSEFPQNTTRPHHLEFFNGAFSVVFDRENGSIKQVSSPEMSMNMTQTWGYYKSFDFNIDAAGKGDNEKQNSGAYIFRPSRSQQLMLTKPIAATFQHTSSALYVHVEYDVPWLKTTTRVIRGANHLEVEYTVGPIPIEDGRGKEIVTRLSSTIKNAGTFYTDSNGREFMLRKRDYRPTWMLNVTEPIAGNYYPVSAAIYIEDSNSGQALAVATDRSQGGSSLQDGSIELMVNRRTLVDDARGVGEPLNETEEGITPCPPFGNATRLGKGVVIRGKHRILVGSKGGAALVRPLMDLSFVEPLVFVGSSPADATLPFQRSNFSGIVGSLPPNVMLLTRMPLVDEKETTFLLRLGHQYGLGEDKELSKKVQVDLANCLPGYKIKNIIETTLSANQLYSSWLESRFDWTDGSRRQSFDRQVVKGTVITLDPMDIRTFKVIVSSHDLKNEFTQIIQE